MNTKLSTIKIVFMGTPFFAKELLKYLTEEGLFVVQVITQPDKPTGRKKIETASAVKQYALNQKIPVRELEKIRNEDIIFLRNLKPQLIIVAAFGVILPREILTIPTYQCINVHTSLLPDLRGASPMQEALKRGYKETGVTLMLMDEKMDQGAILAQEKISIDKAERLPSLEKKLLWATKKILAPTLQTWLEKKIKPLVQDHQKATYTKLIKSEAGRISWNETAREIYQKFQAYYLWPQIYAFWQDPNKDISKKIILSEIELDESIDIKTSPGKIIQLADQKIAVGTKKGLLVLKAVQLEGKKSLPIENFLNGQPRFINSFLS